MADYFWTQRTGCYSK